MDPTLTLRAWYRAGLPSTLSARPAAGSGRAAIPARLTLGSAMSTDVPVDLMGPGDVGGLDPAQVRRTEPADGCPDFEPAMFPYVELRDPDLPWRFTPEGPVAGDVVDPEHAGTRVPQQRLQPWLALVVVPVDETVLAAPTGASTARITCDAALLPDAAETWAWVHVHSGAEGSDRGTFARALCPVRLEPDRQYLACVVPAYAAGVVAAGLQAPSVDPLGPAWPAAGSATLPVYYSWSFGTSGAGTFETLARRLRPRQAPAEATGVTVRVDAAGWGATAASGATVSVQGAVRPLGTGPEQPADAAYAVSLAKAVSADGPGLQLRPPLYGQDHAAGATTVTPPTQGATSWFGELNTDVRRRAAAGLAAWAVIVDQDDLVDQAWSQLSGARPDSVGSTSTEVADAVTGSIVARHPGVVGSVRTLARVAVDTPAAAPAAAPATALFRPAYDTPAFGLLRATSPDWVLPGLDGIPMDSVVLMRTNPTFVEAFLVGLDHALGRELQWRRFPLDPTGTMFRSFWPSAGVQTPDMAAIDSWDPASSLGTHLTETDQLVLVLRGSLVRRFPTTTIYLSGQSAGGPEEHVRADFEAAVGTDTTLVGFPRSLDDLTADSSGQVWSVVLQEAVEHPRFGLDEAPGGGSTADLATWQDLDWAHPQVTGRRHVPVAGPLLGVGRQVAPTTSLGVPPVAHWGADSAAQAAALTRAAVRVRIPVSLWLPRAETPDGG